MPKHNETQAFEDLISDLNEVCPNLSRWAEDQNNAGLSSKQIKDKIREALRLVSQTRTPRTDYENACPTCGPTCCC